LSISNRPIVAQYSHLQLLRSLVLSVSTEIHPNDSPVDLLVIG